MKRYNDLAIVLRSYKLKEADRIVVLLTREHGKVRAVARGVRKMKSRFGSRLEPFNHIDVQIHKGKAELDFIVEVESIYQFPVIRSSLKRLDSAFNMLEVMDLVAMEGHPKIRLYQMLLGALTELEKSYSPVLVPAFYLKLLDKEGFRPVLDVCVVCGSNQKLTRFDFEEGGMCCPRCEKGHSVTPQTQELMGKILNGKLLEALNSNNSKSTNEELAKLALRYLEYRFERQLKTADTLV